MELRDRISVMKGDITKIAADIIVNAANSSLQGGEAWTEPYIKLPGNASCGNVLKYLISRDPAIRERQ